MALGGGLNALGASITEAGRERREMRGLMLREQYFMQRLERQHELSALDREDRQTFAAQQAADAAAAADARQGRGFEHDREMTGIREAGATERHGATLANSLDVANIREAGADRRHRETLGHRSAENEADRALRRGEHMAEAAARIEELTKKAEDPLRSIEVQQELAKMYVTTDELTGEKTGLDLVRDANAIYAEGKEYPWEIKPTAREIVSWGRTKGYDSFDDVIQRMGLLGFQDVTQLVQGRARRLWGE